MDNQRYPDVVPADWVPGPQQGSWTYEEYARLKDGWMHEVSQGILITKPMPDTMHQRVCAISSAFFGRIIEDRQLGRIYSGPINVCLSEKEVFQPDLVVVLHEHLDRVEEKRLVGPPDLVVEVTSPESWLHDRINKYMVYSKFGIPEYWFIDPQKQTIEIFVLENNSYISLGHFQGEQQISSRLIPEINTTPVHFFS